MSLKFNPALGWVGPISNGGFTQTPKVEARIGVCRAGFEDTLDLLKVSLHKKWQSYCFDMQEPFSGSEDFYPYKHIKKERNVSLNHYFSISYKDEVILAHALLI